VLDSGVVGPGFKSQPRRCRVTVLSKLLTLIVPLFTKQRMVAALLRVARVTAGLEESNGSLYRLVYDSLHLQANCQEPGSAPKPYARYSSMGYLYLFYWPDRGQTDRVTAPTRSWLRRCLRLYHAVRLAITQLLTPHGWMDGLTDEHDRSH